MIGGSKGTVAWADGLAGRGAFEGNQEEARRAKCVAGTAGVRLTAWRKWRVIWDDVSG